MFQFVEDKNGQAIIVKREGRVIAKGKHSDLDLIVQAAMAANEGSFDEAERLIKEAFTKPA